MIVDLGDWQIKVWFRYPRVAYRDGDGIPIFAPYGRTRAIECLIGPADEWVEDHEISTVPRGVALCHWKDNFCRVTGRKIALQRALQQAGLSREERGKVWDEYRRTHKVVAGRQRVRYDL